MMSRAACAFKQSDVARCVRAAKQAGAAAVEVRPNGCILIVIEPPPGGLLSGGTPPSDEVAVDEEIVL